MVKVSIGKYLLDTEDIIGKCPACNGDMYSVPQFAKTLNLTPDMISDLELGIVKIGLCPECNKIYFFTE